MNNSVKFISKTLFYVSRSLAVAYFVVTTYSAFCLLSGIGLMLREDGEKFTITFPFTDNPFLSGSYNLPYILFDFLLVIGFYGLFFYLAGNVFRLFHQPRLFTANGVKQLRRFYLVNLFLPVSGLILASVFADVGKGIELLVAVHLVLGVFAYFLAAIFTQGVNLQSEHDLII